MVKGWFSAKFCPLMGTMNFDEGMLDWAAMTPMGAGLQEPPTICLPFVMLRPVVRQKLMKLFDDVSDAVWPGSGLRAGVSTCAPRAPPGSTHCCDWPSDVKLAMTCGESVSDVWGSLPSGLVPLVGAVPLPELEGLGVALLMLLEGAPALGSGIFGTSSQAPCSQHGDSTYGTGGDAS